MFLVVTLVTICATAVVFLLCFYAALCGEERPRTRVQLVGKPKLPVVPFPSTALHEQPPSSVGGARDFITRRERHDSAKLLHRA